MEGVDVVFDFEATAEEYLSSAAKDLRADPRHRTIVCRHWIKGLCQKGDYCDYLHQMDLDKMPVCKWGSACMARPNCMFKHVEEEEKPECVFYQQGFCKLGPLCRYKHVKRQQEECPEVADFTLWQHTGTQGAAGDENGETIQPANFKTSLCKHWRESSQCPFGAKCHFAHGEHELQKFRDTGLMPRSAPKADGAAPRHGPGGPMADRRGPPRMRGGLPPQPPKIAPEIEQRLPVAIAEKVRYFVLKSPNFHNLGVSLGSKKWVARRKHMRKLNNAVSEADKVIIIMSVNGSGHFQGCARVASPVTDIAGKSEWAGTFDVEWLRLCELPFLQAVHLCNPLCENLPVTISRDGQELAPDIGKQLLGLIYAADEVKLGEDKMRGELQRPLEAFVDQDVGPQFPVAAGRNGVVITTQRRWLDESLGKLVFGMMERDAQALGAAGKELRAGDPVFLMDVDQRLVFGIFEAATPITPRLDPGLCSGGPGATPIPHQVRVRVALEAAPAALQDPAVVDILPPSPTPVNITAEQSQCLATLMARRAGALNMGAALGYDAAMAGAAASVPQGQNKPLSEGGWYVPILQFSEKVVIDIPPTAKDRTFPVGRRLVGRGGEHIKRINEAVGGGVKLRLRGTGSGFLEGPMKMEAPEGLHMILSSNDATQLQAAVGLLRELIEEIRRERLRR
ncbi:unnamed protein product [Chrysoparadoxa australica]